MTAPGNNKDLDEENPSTRVAADKMSCFSSTSLSCFSSTSFSLTLTAFIFIILVAVGFVVGVAWSAKSPASSKTINVTSNQVAVVATDPIDNYVEFGEEFALIRMGRIILLTFIFNFQDLLIRMNVLLGVNVLKVLKVLNSEDLLTMKVVLLIAGATWIR